MGRQPAPLAHKLERHGLVQAEDNAFRDTIADELTQLNQDMSLYDLER